MSSGDQGLADRLTGGGPAARGKVWDRLADLITRRPGRVLALGLLPVLLPLLALPWLDTTHNTLDQLPAEADSVRGFERLAEFMGPGETSPLIVVIDGDSSVYDPESFQALGDLSRNLHRLPEVSTVRSVAMPTAGVAPADEDEEAAAELVELEDGLQEAAEGARELEDGVGQVADGVDEIAAEVPERPPGVGDIGEAVDGADALAAGAAQLTAGAEELAAGARTLAAGAYELAAGLAEARAGASELAAGVAEARDGAVALRDEVALPAVDSIEDAAEAIESFTVGRADPEYAPAAEAVGETYALLTGRYPPGHPLEGEQIDDDYDGLPAALEELAEGLDEAVAGAGELEAGLAEAEAGARELAAGARALAAGADELAAGAAQLTGGGRELAAGLEDGARQLQAAGSDLQELNAALGQLRQGIRGELLPGAGELADELTEGARQLDETDLDALIGLDDEVGPFVLTPALLDAEPGLREDLTFFVTDDETRTRLLLSLDQSPFAAESLAAVTDIAEIAERSLLGSPLVDAEVLPTGTSAAIHEVDQAAAADLPIIVAAVITGVFVVLALLLRSLVAPVYMVASVLLTYGAALGVTTIVFQGLLGHSGIQWWIPPLLFVLLVALGVDYSIFLMGRVREEAHSHVTRAAVALGVRTTGRIITSAGLILAATFGALLAAPYRSLAQMGFAAMIGILLDTFVVRALVVPSIATLLGRHNWWPSSRANAA